eukprot:1159139-Pelagomonas_calceolata.AAC.9
MHSSSDLEAIQQQLAAMRSTVSDRLLRIPFFLLFPVPVPKEMQPSLLAAFSCRAGSTLKARGEYLLTPCYAWQAAQ